MSGTSPVAPATSTEQAAVPASAAGTAASPAAGLDLADVGHTEALLQSILQAANATGGIDQSKVAQLQQAIASGAYQVNAQSIAQKIAELEALLGTAGAVR
ncbi:MAG: flagellar biosynthesis anti-sigma factor FlgM [Alphaproteobacteria bacterium]|nr:flagellar biosynthesis anti-sigma factor FlgM [Alphaproteobacteria bacterium]